MRCYLLLFAVLLACLVSPNAVAAKSIDQEFLETLQSRDARYAVDQKTTLAAFNAAAQALSAATANATDSIEPNYPGYVSAIEEIGKVDGRGWLLRDLLILMETKPSPTRLDLWFQERAEQINSDSVKAAALLADLQKSGAGQSPRYLDAMLIAVRLAGRVQGGLQEIRLIDQNVTIYLQAKGQRDARRQAGRSRFFAALGAAGAAMRAAQPPPPPPVSTWSATCNTSGNFTRCSGIGH